MTTELDRLHARRTELTLRLKELETEISQPRYYGRDGHMLGKAAYHLRRAELQGEILGVQRELQTLKLDIRKLEDERWRARGEIIAAEATGPALQGRLDALRNRITGLRDRLADDARNTELSMPLRLAYKAVADRITDLLEQ